MTREQRKQAKLRAKAEKGQVKLYTFRNWIKEIKRVIWPKSAKSWKWFGITILFLVLMAAFCFAITLGFSSLWNSVGIKA